MRVVASIAAAAWGLAATLSAIAAPGAVLLRNGVVHTGGPLGTLDGASVLIVDGRIAAVGPGLAAPAGAEVVDLHGRPVTPALFGGLAPLGVNEVGAEEASDDATLMLGQMHPEFDPSIVFNPRSVTVAVARAGGIGFALLTPGATPNAKGGPGSSVVAGLAAVVRLDGQRPQPPVALEVIAGEDSSRLAGHSRAAAYMLLAQAFEEARGGGGAVGDPRLLTPAGRRVLKGFLAEQKPFLFDVDRAADIEAVIDFAEREKISPVIVGGAEAWRVADRLARRGIPVVLDPLDDLPAQFESIGATLENAARLHAAGVTIVFSQRAADAQMVRKIRQAAGNAVAHGLPWDAALAAMTSAPAKVFRAAPEFGGIEAGRPANLVVWSADPLEVTSRVDAEWLDGRPQSLRSRQTDLRDRYLEKVRSGTAR